VREVSLEREKQIMESYLYAKKDAPVVAKVGGMINEIYAELGDDVGEGDTLARIEDDVPWLQFELARNAFDQAKQDFGRAKTLYDKKLISQTEYEQARLRFEQTDIERRCALEKFRHTRLVAPFSGVVVSGRARIGQVVQAGDSLFHITQRAPVYTRVYLTEEEHTRLKTDGRVEIQPKYGEKSCAWGTIVKKSPAIDPVAGTIELVIRIDPKSNVCKPGMTVNVLLEPIAPSTALALPKIVFPHSHDLSPQATTTVHVSRSGVATPLTVQLGEDLDSLWEIKGNVRVGDTVMISFEKHLPTGEKLRTNPQDSPSER
jgi:RND family efflux transporter MFP subunit